MTARGTWLKTYVIELKLLVDGELSTVKVCDYCGNLWLYCNHSGTHHDLNVPGGIEYLLSCLEVL